MRMVAGLGQDRRTGPDFVAGRPLFAPLNGHHGHTEHCEQHCPTVEHEVTLSPCGASLMRSLQPPKNDLQGKGTAPVLGKTEAVGVLCTLGGGGARRSQLKNQVGESCPEEHCPEGQVVAGRGRAYDAGEQMPGLHHDLGVQPINACWQGSAMTARKMTELEEYELQVRNLIRVVSVCTLGLWSFAAGVLIGTFYLF